MKVLIIGGGISGVALAAMLKNTHDCLILERSKLLGGWCKTIKRNGFVWDYSGHFFHFKEGRVQQYFVDAIGAGNLAHVKKKSKIYYKGRYIDYPFQKNIHQLEFDDFIDCLCGLVDPSMSGDRNFEEFIRGRFGDGITDRFLAPYNEKLYACKLSELDVHAMGRFFPNPSLKDIVRNFRSADNTSYNDSFIYPYGGAYEFVKAFTPLSLPVEFEVDIHNIDLVGRTVGTNKGEFTYDYLISTAPLSWLAHMLNATKAESLRANRVFVFNIGFDRGSAVDDHWLYFPDEELPFYRVGFYNNVVGDNSRMSLYVEVGQRADTEGCEYSLDRILSALRFVGIVTDQLVVDHCVLEMSPAYCHLSSESIAFSSDFRERLGKDNIFSVGRYGRWTYCSIEDNLLEVEALAIKLGLMAGSFFGGATLVA